jgi:hypothetical protein
LTNDEWRAVAQSAAEHFRAVSGAQYAVVFFTAPGSDKLYVGAQVPELSILRRLLEQALINIDRGSATIIDNRVVPK